MRRPLFLKQPNQKVTRPLGERVLLIGLTRTSENRSVTAEHLQELEQLVTTIGYEVAAVMIIQPKRFEPATMISRGKIDEIAELLNNQAIDEVVFDDDLTPTQLRNLQEIFDCEVRDRSSVILEIFARHARTKEAKTQIELATLEYLLPRLTRRWTHLERQIGGIGVRGGAGETQIEMDRRLVKTRIAKLNEALEAIERERLVQRKGRRDCFHIAIVGYTNAGKSTLLNVLTGAEVKVEDQLFATLDTTVRKLTMNGFQNLLLSDTIGFIRKLPADLIASFRSTLREIQEADLILKVADLSSPYCLEHLDTVDEVLHELGVITKPIIVVFNKIDCSDDLALKRARNRFPEAVFISAARQLRLDELRQAIVRVLEQEGINLQVRLPLSAAKAIALVRDNAQIRAETYINGEVSFELFCYRRVWNWLAPKLREFTKTLNDSKHS